MTPTKDKYPRPGPKPRFCPKAKVRPAQPQRDQVLTLRSQFYGYGRGPKLPPTDPKMFPPRLPSTSTVPGVRSPRIAKCCSRFQRASSRASSSSGNGSHSCASSEEARAAHQRLVQVILEGLQYPVFSASSPDNSLSAGNSVSLSSSGRQQSHDDVPLESPVPDTPSGSVVCFRQEPTYIRQHTALEPASSNSFFARCGQLLDIAVTKVTSWVRSWF